MSTQHLNQSQLAERWNISPRTLERWRWLGQGPRFLKIGGRVIYRVEDIQRFEELSSRASTDNGTPLNEDNSPLSDGRFGSDGAAGRDGIEMGERP